MAEIILECYRCIYRVCLGYLHEKSCIQATLNLSTDADCITIAMKRKEKLNEGIFFFCSQKTFFRESNILWGRSKYIFFLRESLKNFLGGPIFFCNNFFLRVGPKVIVF